MKLLDKPIRRLLPPLPPPRCPKCGKPCGEDIGTQSWVVIITPEGGGSLEFRELGTRRERYRLPFHEAVNFAIERGRVL